MRIRSPHSRLFATSLTAIAVLAATTSCAGSSGGSASSGKSLAVSIAAGPAGLDPVHLTSDQTSYIWSSLYDTLLYLDNQGKVQPNAASSWTYTDDARTLTLKLRKGMTFSNGHAVNATAVVDTLNLIRTTPGNNQQALAAVSKAAAPDALTIVLHLSHPDPNLLNSLSTMAGVIGDPATLTKGSTATDPVGSGPYTLDKATTVAGTTYVLKRRADYWNAKAYPYQTFTARVLTPTASINALRSGEVQASIQGMGASAFKAPTYTTKLIPASSVGTLVIGDRKGGVVPALGNLKVRQAINMAFDRPGMVKALLQGAGAATDEVFNPQGPLYVPSLAQKYTHDIAKAKSLMAEAGYPHGFTLKMPSFYYMANVQPTIGQALSDIGIKVDWVTVPMSGTPSAILSKKYGMFFYFNSVDTAPAEININLSKGGLLNPFDSTDPALTPLLDKVYSETDQSKLDAVYQQIGTFMADNAWDAPLFQVNVNWVLAKGVTFLGTGATQFNSVRQFGVAG
ncbi:ABC transporter substrate-binding protein [Streptomyces sp. NPDC048278]|uniref:ABC transporter substrate-binding protein n=1 Tax=Streptomyces sp. NPDC048278 TaxID=3155809 RepID=UPI00343FE4DA